MKSDKQLLSDKDIIKMLKSGRALLVEPSHYHQLEKDCELLYMLQAADVEEWSGYDAALEEGGFSERWEN